MTSTKEQIGVLLVENKGDATALDQHMSERGNVMDYIKGLRDQRDELNQDIQAKTAGPALQSLKESFEMVCLVPLQEQILMDML